MAVLTHNPGTGYEINDIAPQGQYLGVCLEIEDRFGVTRKKFNSEEEEPRDVTRLLFGLKDLQTGAVYLVQTYEYTISALPNSNLIKFLTQWLGKQPQIGWDYCELKSTGCMITIAHKEAKNTPGKFYPKIMSIAPVMPQMAASVPNPVEFAVLVEAATNGSDAPAGAAQQAGAVAGSPLQAGQTTAPPVGGVAALPVATAPTFPYGWTQHPQSPAHYFEPTTQEVLLEADLRARFEPTTAPPVAAIPPAPPVGGVAAPPVANPQAPPSTPDPAPALPPTQAGAPAANPF